MLKVEFKDFSDNLWQQDLTCKADDFPVLQQLSSEVGFSAPILFRLRCQKSGQLVEVDGSLSTRVELDCGRCLQLYEKELRAEFAFTFTPYPEPEAAAQEGEEVELETDELGLVFYRDETLDLLAPLQDQLVMALPISPLCAVDCKGLCPQCGCNLNVESCNCEKKIFNNKFSALAGLKIESDN